MTPMTFTCKNFAFLNPLNLLTEADFESRSINVWMQFRGSYCTRGKLVVGKLNLRVDLRDIFVRTEAMKLCGYIAFKRRGPSKGRNRLWPSNRKH